MEHLFDDEAGVEENKKRRWEGKKEERAHSPITPVDPSVELPQRARIHTATTDEMMG
jgi:DNA topoisomerase IA